MHILEILRQDYQRFPKEQTFDIYAENVFFKDPLNQFRGVDRYQKMITFLDFWFSNIHLDLHQLEQNEQIIRSNWTLYMTCPLPWQPRLKISGYSLLELDTENQIISHTDYWDDAPTTILKQLFSGAKSA